MDDKLNEGYDVYLDIEVQGAMQIKAQRPETLMIFVMPPSLEELERRLITRGTDSMDVISGRLQQAQEEFKLREQFDFTVVNDEVERAVAEISGMIDGYKKGINIK